MNSNQCLNFGYSGGFYIGDHSAQLLIPSIVPGTKYVLRIVASNDAQVRLICTLTSTSPSCVVSHDTDGGSE
ncbi:MAG: hypothetical protein OK457_00005, partial [Thaumarchaeota archaeon]|nr:hypothetical protein [Nitrososphaerota archaeon]